MTDTRPARLIDPVCGMAVDVARAEAGGLLLEREGRTFGFCGPACRQAFLDDAEPFVRQAEAADAAVAIPSGDALPVIDEGMRRWYESCSCCLSEAYPEIKARLDAEREARSATPVEPGICEVAESAARA